MVLTDWKHSINSFGTCIVNGFNVHANKPSAKCWAFSFSLHCRHCVMCYCSVAVGEEKTLYTLKNMSKVVNKRKLEFRFMYFTILKIIFVLIMCICLYAGLCIWVQVPTEDKGIGVSCSQSFRWLWGATWILGPNWPPRKESACSSLLNHPSSSSFSWLLDFSKSSYIWRKYLQITF